LGKWTKFLTIVTNLESGEPVRFGQDRTQATLDAFFQTELSRGQRSRIQSACVDMWQSFTTSLHTWAPQCRIVYDKFHVMQHANAAVDEVRRAEFFRKGGIARQIVKGERWLLLSRWVHLSAEQRHQLNALFALNRRVLKAYLLKESLDRLWTYRYEGAMYRYLQSWMRQLRWQRLPHFRSSPRCWWTIWMASSTTVGRRSASEWWKPSTATSKRYCGADAGTPTCGTCCSRRSVRP
jgi:transposase